MIYIYQDCPCYSCETRVCFGAGERGGKVHQVQDQGDHQEVIAVIQ